MENQTSFDLNRQLQAWRENLSQSPAFRGENLDELEAHLLDSVHSLQARGLSAEEAFMVAAKRVGNDGVLMAEFGKVNRSAVWLDRILWMLVGLQLWSIVNNFTTTITRSVSTLVLVNLEVGHPDQRMVLFATVAGLFQLLALAASLGICWWLIMRKGTAFGVWLRRLSKKQRAFMGVGFVLGAFVLESFFYVGFNMLLFKFVNFPTSNEVLQSQAYSSLPVRICHTITLLVLTIMLARKRLALSRAV